MSRRRRTAVDDLGPSAREQAQAAVGQVPTEEDEQRWLVQWADAQYLADGQRCVGDYLLAIPNGGARHKAEGGKLKAQGVRAGVPDLFLAIPAAGMCGLWIELKRQKGGGVTDAQREWHTRLAAAGYGVAVARGWREAAQAIQAHLYPDLGDPDDE